MIKYGLRRPLAVTAVLAATAAVLPAQSYAAGPTGFHVAFPCPSTDPQTFCSFSVYPGVAVPAASPLPAPHPGALATDGVAGCVTGPSRPVVSTTRPVMAATFTGPAQPIDVTFELQPVDGSEAPEGLSTTTLSGVAVIMEPFETGLRPGVSYRWRVHATYTADRPQAQPDGWSGTAVVAPPEVVPVWSGWCEFAVAAGLTDLTGATDVDTVRELGVDPARRYLVTLPVRGWRLILESDMEAAGVSFDSGGFEEETDDRLKRMYTTIRTRTANRPAAASVTVTLTGDEWASLLLEAAIWAAALDESDEEDTESEFSIDGSATWKTIDRISTAIGGPAHPSLGYDR